MRLEEYGLAFLKGMRYGGWDMPTSSKHPDYVNLQFVLARRGNFTLLKHGRTIGYFGFSLKRYFLDTKGQKHYLSSSKFTIADLEKFLKEKGI